MDIRFNPVWPWWLTLLLAAGLAGFAVWTYPPTTPRRSLLLGFRLAAIAVAMFAFLRPVLEFKKIVEQSSTLLVLYDKSRSMTLKDAWGGQSRFEAMRQVRGDADEDMTRLAEKVRIREYVFDRRLDEVDEQTWTVGPNGRQTAVGDALEKSLEVTGDERIAGVLLLTDGASNAGVDPAEIRGQIAARNIPVHAFGFGSESASDSVRDIVPLKIDVSPTAFRRNRFPVRVEFQTAGYGGRSIPVQLKFNGEVKGKGVLQPAAGGQRASIELVGVPAVSGDMKVTVEADAMPGELVPDNNSVSTYVSVRSDGLSVLHLEGKYRFWEPKFVRRSIDLSPDIDLTQVFLLDESGRPHDLPDDLFEPGKFDVIVIGDLPASRIPPAQMRQLGKLLESGAGLLMIGGYESFGPGGWGDSPLANFLPVLMRAGDTQLEREMKLTPTDAGLRHFVLRLAAEPDANKKLWETLRALDGGSQWAGLRPSALVLAETPDRLPMLVAQDVGRNRTLAFTSDTTWRWATKSKDSKSYHARFWRQLILWLAHREDASGDQVKIKLDRRRVAVGEKLPLEVMIESKDGKTPNGLQITATLQNVGGGEAAPFTLTRKEVGYTGAIDRLEKAGDYMVSVSVTQDGNLVGSAQAKFLVFDDDLELQQIAADFEPLRRLANDTRGDYMPAEKFPEFVKSLLARDLNQEITKPVVENLWDRWEVLAAFVALLVAEWFIRKRSGLV